ncbi:MAG: hypothetical protein ACK55D_12045 [Synechococcaceae cyanobacterium]
MQTLLQEQGINWELVEERQNGSPLELAFTGQRRADQEAAVEAIQILRPRQSVAANPPTNTCRQI